jgi:predicted Zn-dependent protease
MSGSPTMMETGPILSKADAEAIAKKVLSMAKAPQTEVHIATNNAQNTRFARSEITTQRDRAGGLVTITTTIGKRVAIGRTQRFDDDGLRVALQWSEDAAKDGPGEVQASRAVAPRTYDMSPKLWSDATHKVDIAPRVDAVVQAIEHSKGYVGAGSLDVTAASQLVANSKGLVAYCRETESSFNMSARSPDNTGSGWAHQLLYDHSLARPGTVAERAVDKAQRSRNPSSVEPGRYTAILEPAAYADMVTLMMMFHMGLDGAERGSTVFANPSGGTKIGLKVLDERLSFVSDPLDKEGPYCPFTPTGVPLRRTPWIDHGVLRHLAYDDARAEKNNEEFPVANPVAVRLEPDPSMKRQTLEEMIASCERGIYITRMTTGFADFRYLVFTGVTRDGTWLIEKGKISRPIKNMRYLESHLFFLNNLEAVGEPTLAAFAPPPIVLPPVKVRDFNFTALADAV